MIGGNDLDPAQRVTAGMAGHDQTLGDGVAEHAFDCCRDGHRRLACPEHYDRARRRQIKAAPRCLQQPTVVADQPLDSTAGVGCAQSRIRNLEHDLSQLGQTVVKQLIGVADDRLG